MLIVERFLVCNGENCGENFGVDSRDSSMLELRESSKDAGWHTNGTHDWCEECWEKIKKARRK